MWSFGCIVAEMFLGLPLFPGGSEFNQLCRITEFQGLPNEKLVDMGKFSKQYLKPFDERQTSRAPAFPKLPHHGRQQYPNINHYRPKYVLKSAEEYSQVIFILKFLLYYRNLVLLLFIPKDTLKHILCIN